MDIKHLLNVFKRALNEKNKGKSLSTRLSKTNKLTSISRIYYNI